MGKAVFTNIVKNIDYMAMLPDLRKKCWKPFSIFGGANNLLKKLKTFQKKKNVTKILYAG